MSTYHFYLTMANLLSHLPDFFLMEFWGASPMRKVTKQNCKWIAFRDYHGNFISNGYRTIYAGGRGERKMKEDSD